MVICCARGFVPVRVSLAIIFTRPGFRYQAEVKILACYPPRNLSKLALLLPSNQGVVCPIQAFFGLSGLPCPAKALSGKEPLSAGNAKASLAPDERTVNEYASAPKARRAGPPNVSRARGLGLETDESREP
jgi:hypothetical protein